MEKNNKEQVRAWRESVVIPTYEIGRAEKTPIFLEKRVYQGSSGVVYPYPVIESISDEKEDHEYQAIYLENEYIKVMILPELGGRVQMAYDKIRQRHFVYYNHVVKPALVGLTGPWISGGIEFNWPQHHRPSTFLPVDSTIEEHTDGSITVWVNEMERMFHQKGMAGFTLRPGCAYLEIKGVLYNRTDMPQTFLWWANPAVAVNDQYQSVFPPDIHAVFDHGKRAVSSFPIATGTYYKMDYSAGVDISNYRNIKVPTSYMAVNSKYDFEGGYENDTQAGMLHVASHHFSPGKKQWTWGNGDFGRAWDRNLTDEDGPYIELMAGVYTENQPDFTWLMPYEEKHFTQYFMPYRELGIVKQASKDFILNLTPTSDENGVRLQLLATSQQEVRLLLQDEEGTIYYDKETTLSPEAVWDETIAVRKGCFKRLHFRILRSVAKGRMSEEALSWQAESDELRPIPDAAEAALLPQDVKTNEQLYLTGLHLEQYRHATYSPVDYYEEALRRDPQDYRCLNALGLWYLRRGRFDKAEDYLRRAVRVITRRNPNPYDGEPIFNLGLALKYQALANEDESKLSEAYERFWKSTWNKAWADAGYLEAAKISIAQGRFADALDELDRALQNNWHNHKARALRAAVLRHLGSSAADCLATDSQQETVLSAFLEESLRIDRFNYGIRYEQYLLTGDTSLLDELKRLLRHSSDNYDELALDYLQAGLDEEALAIWKIAEQEGASSPMTYYYQGDYQRAEQQSIDYCFPNRLEAIVALEAAKKANSTGAHAPYLLGCLYYDKRQYDLAIQNWELSSTLDAKYPTVWRNLALAYFNKLNRHEEALRLMERAFSLDESDARILMELDQLRRRLQWSHAQRLELLQHNPQLIQQRDDLRLEEITLLNQLGRHEEAMHLLDAHHFHPWEGGEGKVTAQYQICRVELAKKLLATSEERGKTPKAQAPEGGACAELSESLQCAIRLLQEALLRPINLGEGKLHGAQENDIYYFLGLAYEMAGMQERAQQAWTQATQGPQEPTAALYYNDAQPDKIFYQGLALRRLGHSEEAKGRFHRLENYGRQHFFESPRLDYFAVSLPDLLIWDDSLDTRNRVHCLLLLALGHYGLGDSEGAQRFLAEVERMDCNHQAARALRTLMGLKGLD